MGSEWLTRNTDREREREREVGAENGCSYFFNDHGVRQSIIYITIVYFECFSVIIEMS